MVLYFYILQLKSSHNPKTNSPELWVCSFNSVFSFFRRWRSLARLLFLSLCNTKREKKITIVLWSLKTYPNLYQLDCGLHVHLSTITQQPRIEHWGHNFQLWQKEGLRDLTKLSTFSFPITLFPQWTITKSNNQHKCW